MIDAEEVDIGVGFGRGVGGVSDQEADRDDDLEAFVDAGLDIGFVVGLGLGLDELVFQVVFISGGDRAFMRRLVEGAVIDAPEVGDQADGFDAHHHVGGLVFHHVHVHPDRPKPDRRRC